MTALCTNNGDNDDHRDSTQATRRRSMIPSNDDGMNDLQQSVQHRRYQHQHDPRRFLPPLLPGTTSRPSFLLQERNRAMNGLEKQTLILQVLDDVLAILNNEDDLLELEDEDHKDPETTYVQ